MSKTEVDYVMNTELREEIKYVRNHIAICLKEASIYLFGSIAKGRYSDRSDIDFLILIPEDKDTKEIRQLRHFIEDKIEESYHSRLVDIKIYSKKRYEELCQKPCFEQCIKQDLVSVMGW